MKKTFIKFVFSVLMLQTRGIITISIIDLLLKLKKTWMQTRWNIYQQKLIQKERN